MSSRAGGGQQARTEDDDCFAVPADRGGNMGLIHIDLFSTLDGVAQAPGAPDEDTEGGFPFGGWQAPLFDDVVGEQVNAGMEGLDALLLGRKTYDIFAGFWPQQEDGVDGGIAKLFNGVPKYVASRGKPVLEWTNTELLGPDLVAAVREVRDRHANVHVIGSIDLVQTLLAERLFDRLSLWVFPVVLGVGKKVFARGGVPANLALTEPPVTSTTGAVLLRYALADGIPGTGDMTLEDRGVQPTGARPAR
jgi:dihydrofolate reductase